VKRDWLKPFPSKPMFWNALGLVTAFQVGYDLGAGTAADTWAWWWSGVFIAIGSLWVVREEYATGHSEPKA
jgi:hypothetical protein